MSISVIECYMPGQAGSFFRGLIGSVENLSNSIAVDNLEEKVGVAPTGTQSQNQPIHQTSIMMKIIQILSIRKPQETQDWLNVEEEKGWV